MGGGGEKAYVMGVDAGTTNIKAALFDLQGNLVSQASQPISNYHPLPGYSEMDPEEIWTKTLGAIRQCALSAPVASRIVAMGWSSTKGCLLLLDEEDRPLTPLITWRDERAHGLYRRSGLDLYARTGVPAAGDTLPKLMWFKENRNEVLQRAQRVFVSQKDFLLHRLLNTFVIDRSLGQTSMLFSLESLDWDEELLSHGGVRRIQLATLVDDTEIVGRLSPEWSASLGLPEGTQVVIGGDDGCMSQVGLGAVTPGRIGANLGTGAAMRAFTPRYVLDPLRMLDCKCLLPYGFVQTGITADAGRIIDWLRRDLFFERRGESGIDKDGDPASAMVDEIPPGCEGLLFLPYFTLASSTVIKGEGTSGTVFGLNYHHTAGHFLRAAMEGVGLTYKNIADRMIDLGLPVEEIVLGGGGSRSSAWRCILAHILGRPVCKTQVEEASALGAAIMAAIGLGAYRDLEEATRAMVQEREEERCWPDPALHERYGKIQALFNQVHQSLECGMKQHHRIWREGD